MVDSFAIGFCWFVYAFVDFVSLRSLSRTIWHIRFLVALYTISSVIALYLLCTTAVVIVKTHITVYPMFARSVLKQEILSSISTPSLNKFWVSLPPETLLIAPRSAVIAVRVELDNFCRIRSLRSSYGREDKTGGRN